MRLFNNKQLRLQIIAAAADSILFYIGFLLANQIAGGSSISIVFFLITALGGLFANFLPYNISDKRKHSLIIGIIGLALAIVSIGISAINGFNLFALPIGFIALVFLYYRSYTSYLANILYVFTAGSFYKSAVLLFIINAAAVFWGRNFNMLSDQFMRYTVLYIIIALYMLSEVKNFRYVSKNENSHRTTFDIAATGFMIIITVVMSLPKVFKMVIFPFVEVFKFIYSWVVKAILLITYPIGLLMNYIYNLIELKNPEGLIKPNYDNMLGMPDKYEEALKNTNSPLVQLIGKALAFALMLMLCAYAIYLLFRFLNRITRSEEEQDFVEEKEFILKSNKPRNAGVIGKLAAAMKKAADSVLFMMTADNRDKLRSEYKSFVQKLHNNKIIESYNYTAQDILQLMLFKIPDRKNELVNITGMYEMVRYGTRYPDDNELKSFRKNMAEISRNLQLLQ